MTSDAASLAPMLSVRRGSRAVDFYKSAFGARELFRIEAPDGSVVAELSIDGSKFWVADESPEHLNFSPESLNGSTTRLVLVVDDPAVVFARAIAAGAKKVSPVRDHDYGWRVGRVVDPFGHHWEIGRPLSGPWDTEDARRRALSNAGSLMQFTKRLREGIRRGRIRCSIRIWTRPHVKVGGRYRMDDGHIVVDSITPIDVAEITYDLARESGFESVDDLVSVARHGRGDNAYLIRFHYLPPGAWDTPKRTATADPIR